MYLESKITMTNNLTFEHFTSKLESQSLSVK